MCENARTVLKFALLREICQRLVNQQTGNLRRNAIFGPLQTVKPAPKRFHTAWAKSSQLRNAGNNTEQTVAGVKRIAIARLDASVGCRPCYKKIFSRGYDFFMLFPINLSTIAKYHLAFKPSRAKDAPTDSELALDLLLRHPEQFPALKPQSAAMRSLLSLIAQRRDLVNDKIRFTNRCKQHSQAVLPTDAGLVWAKRFAAVLRLPHSLTDTLSVKRTRTVLAVPVSELAV